MEEIKQKLKNKLAENKLSDVIHSLEQLTKSNSSLYDQVIALKQRFSALKQKNRQGILDSKDAQLEERQIVHQIIELIDAIDHKNTTNSLRSSPLSTSMLWGLTSGILIIIMMPLVLFFPCPSHEQYFFFRVLFAFIVALFAFIIPQLLKFKHRLLISLFLFPLIFTGAYSVSPGLLYTPSKCQPTHFDYTFFIENEQGTTLALEDGTLVLLVGNDKKLEQIDAKGATTFKQLPLHYRTDSIKVELQNIKGWQFDNGKNSQYLYLKGESARLILKPNDRLCCISGSIRDENSTFLEGITVSIGNISTTTNELGRFELTIPLDKQKEVQNLTAFADGYQIFEADVYPASKEDVKIILQKK